MHVVRNKVDKNKHKKAKDHIHEKNVILHSAVFLPAYSDVACSIHSYIFSFLIKINLKVD
jgi:hypothetical protein